MAPTKANNKSPGGKSTRKSTPKKTAKTAAATVTDPKKTAKNRAKRLRAKRLAQKGREAVRKQAQEAYERGEQPPKKCHLCGGGHWVKVCLQIR
jgi:hypothetical protein